MRIRFPSWLRYSVMLLLLAALWYLIDAQGVVQRLAKVHLGWAVACMVLLVLQTCLNALRWRMTAKRLGHSMAVLDAVKNYFLAQTINGLVPGGIAGDAVRALNAAKHVGLKQAGQAVLFERLSGQSAMITVMFIATLLLLSTTSNPPKLLISGVFTISAIATSGLLAFWLVSRSVDAAAEWLSAARAAVFGYDVFLHQAILSTLSAVLNILAFLLAISAVGGSLAFNYAFVAVPLVLFSMLVPLTPSGWGLREGTALAVLPIIGIAPEAAIAASLLFGLLFQLSSIFSLAILTVSKILPEDFSRRTKS